MNLKPLNRLQRAALLLLAANIVVLAATVFILAKGAP